MTDMTLGDFLSVCDSNMLIKLSIYDPNVDGKKCSDIGMMSAIQIMKLVDACGLGIAEDITTRIDEIYLGMEDGEDGKYIDITLLREDEE